MFHVYVKVSISITDYTPKIIVLSQGFFS